MTYDEALKAANKVGASRAAGDAQLAQTCWVLSRVHAVDPAMLYEGARKLVLSPESLLKMGGAALADVMFA